MLEINCDISVLPEEEIVSCKELFNLFWKKDRNILYITDAMGRFVGIITIGTLLGQMRRDIDIHPCINRECLKVLKGESSDYKKVKDIFEKYHIATAVPVIDEDGNVCHEIRKRSEENKNALTEFKEKIMRYQKSHYLEKEIVCLQRLLEEQDVVVIGDEKQFDLLLGDIFQNKKRVMFLDSCEDVYELMCENNRLLVDLQASGSGGRERIYDVCNNGYSWKRFIDHIIHVIEGGYCSAFYDIIDNEWVTIEDYLKKYMKGGMDFSSRGVFTTAIIKYMREHHFPISEGKGVFRDVSARYMMKMNGTEVGKKREDNEFTLIEFVNTILQLYRLSEKLSDKITVLNFVFDGTLEATCAEKNRISEGIGNLYECVLDKKAEILELYNLDKNKGDEYIEKLARTLQFDQKRTFENNLVLLDDRTSELVNIVNGMRKTCDQPDEYGGTIFFFGVCTIYGLYVEDRYTIPSIIQKYINQLEKKYRVINLGNNCMTNADNLEECLDISKNDIAIFLFPLITDKIKKGIPITEVGYSFNGLRADEYGNPECFLNMTSHCGTNGNIIYSKIIFDELNSHMINICEDHMKRNSVYDVFKKEYRDLNVLYDHKKYIMELRNKQIEYDIKRDEKVGCIVMNSNPFTLGHRYLVEYAADNVDYLYVFVVEENKSFFSFRDRYEMVKRGTDDLKNVLVVRSGNMVVTSTTFPAYYKREKYQETKERPAVGMDLRVFAQYIAPVVNIKYRFVGEEPLDFVTNEYNRQMKEILSEFDIHVIEIPRKCRDGKVISATLVREYYKRKDFQDLCKWVPRTTTEYLLNKMDDINISEEIKML